MSGNTPGDTRNVRSLVTGGHGHLIFLVLFDLFGPDRIVHHIDPHIDADLFQILLDDFRDLLVVAIFKNREFH